MTPRVVLAYTALFLTAMQPSSASPYKEAYELQERCGKRVKEVGYYGVIHSGSETAKDGQTITTYKSHYNTKLNKCFVVITTRYAPSKNNKTDRRGIDRILSDVDEVKEYGRFFQATADPKLSQCAVLEKTCTSAEGWESLIQAFMED
jgi:hypothetical protein